MTYDEPSPGEWVFPRRRGFKMACCDCGLVHRVNLRLVRVGRARFRIEWQMFRDERATAAMRRERRKRDSRAGASLAAAGDPRGGAHEDRTSTEA